ncbi:MAG TPA: hypothetical protein VE604_03040 [Candidatus Polarisedimenticolia bacterium]|jgi:hypothetical protein|nr:hypothetical protein [Candidatus Polarisedimenticolia bacterium]
MNSKLSPAPTKSKARQLHQKTSLSRHSWTRLLAIAVVTLISMASAYAAPGVQVGNQQMFRPRGMVRATVPNPVAGGAPLHDYWVADGASGFCRLDNVGPDTAPSNGILNLSTCYLPAVFAPVDYQVETFGVNGSNGYVFVAGVKEVTRIEFKASPTEPGRTVINQDPGKQVTIFDSTASTFANGLSVAGPRFITATILGPDGKLYICFQGSGDIWRIRNPLSPSFTPAGNIVERVGTSDNGSTLLSLSFVGHDLWMSQAGFLNRIQNADLCNYTLPKCQAMLEFGLIQTQEGLISDQFISKTPNGRWLFFGNGNRVVRYDTFSVFNMQVWNQSGAVCATPKVMPCPVSPVAQEYSLILGMNFIQSATPVALADGSGFIEDMTVTADPIIEAPPPAVAGTLPKTGRTWLYSAKTTLTQEPCVSTPPNPPPCVNSQLGVSPAQDSPSADAARRSVLLLAGLTHPRGLVWLQTNWWISEEDHGFCRIDQNPITGAAGMSHCFKPVGFIPGQPAADKPDILSRQNVYVPDASGDSKGIVRLKFIPDGTGGTVSETGLLNSGRGTASAVALPQGPFNDGAVYVGYYNIGSISKIQQPATAPTAPLPVGGLSRGVGVLSLAFEGNDLYMAELGPPANTAGQLVKGSQITLLAGASPDLQRGSAREIAKPISRLQSPDPQAQTSPQVFINPAALVVGPVGDRERCLPPPGVVLSIRVPADPGTAPGLYIGGLGLPPNSPVSGGLAQPPEVAQYGSICTTMIDWVAEGALDSTLSINVPLGPVTALAFNSQTDPHANLAIADDPGLIVTDQTLQKSKIFPPITGVHGQGHVFIVP